MPWIFDYSAVTKTCGIIVKKMKNPQALYNRVANDMKNEVVKTRFGESKDPEGKAWPMSIRAAATGGKTLIDKGILRKSIHQFSNMTGAIVGTNIRYAAIHNFGGTIKRRAKKKDGSIGKTYTIKMPKRQFIGFTEEMRLRYREMLIRYLQEQ